MIQSFLERDEPLTQLQAVLAKVRSGNGAAVLVTGDAGAGKTTFFGAFEAATLVQARIFRGSCEDLSIPEPLGPLRELARSAGWVLDFDKLKDGQRLEIFAEVLALVHDPDITTILIIEDLHWADEASLDFVRYLARRIDPFRVMLLINSRDTSETARLRLRNAFAGVPATNLTRIQLAPLSQTAVENLASKVGADGKTIFRQSGGNPFFVTELINNGDSDLPANVQDAVLRRVDRLSESAKRIIRAVAVFPRRAEIDLVLTLSKADDFTGIEETIANGLLLAEGNHLAFRHEIARQAVEIGLSQFKRRSLNAGLFELLAKKTTVSKARLMHHARAGGNTDRIRELAPEAALEAQATGAIKQSAEYYEIALEFRHELPDVDRAELLEAAAGMIGIRSDQLKAISCLEEALTIRKSLNQTMACVKVLAMLVRFHWETGDKTASRTLGDKAIQMALGSDSYELAWACAARAHVAMVDYDFETALPLGEQAINLATRHGYSEIESHALSSIGMCHWTNQALALSLFERGRAIVVENKLSQYATRSFTNIAVYLHEHFRYCEALEAFDLGVNYCEEHDISSGVGLLNSWRAELRERMGAWDEASSIAQELLSDKLQHASGRFFCTLLLARISLRRGHPDADDMFRALKKSIENGEDARHLGYLAIFMAERAWLGLDCPKEALELMAKVQAMPVFPIDNQQFFLWQKRLGQTSDWPKEEVFADPYRFGLLGDWQREATAWAEVGSPYHQALALLDGDVRAKSQALRILDRLGAIVVSDFVRRRMKAEGLSPKPMGPRASTLANPAGLTKRQLDVLQLLNDGLSNAEIGEKLFVSAKTVDHHVSAILGKLEVSSRGEAAALAREAGWV